MEPTTCRECEEIVSAHLDGEATAAEWRRAQGHLVGCGSCHAFHVAAASQHRAARLVPAEPVPDLTEAVMGAAEPALGRRSSERGAESVLRLVVALVAGVQLAMAAAAVVGVGGAEALHASRHLGSIDIALAVGALVALWRPERVAGLLPVLASFAALAVATAAVDVARGSTTPAAEVHHVTEVAILVGVWLLAHPPRSRVPSPA